MEQDKHEARLYDIFQAGNRAFVLSSSEYSSDGGSNSCTYY